MTLIALPRVRVDMATENQKPDMSDMASFRRVLKTPRNTHRRRSLCREWGCNLQQSPNMFKDPINYVVPKKGIEADAEIL